MTAIPAPVAVLLYPALIILLLALFAGWWQAQKRKD